MDNEQLVRHDLWCIECLTHIEEAFYTEDVDPEWRGFEGFCLACQCMHVAVEKEEGEDG